MAESKIIGLLGGTFDPIHKGHVNIARLLLEKYPLEHIEFIVNQLPPHREARVSSVHRFKMVKIALEHVNKCVVNDIELKSLRPNYSINTLKKLRQQNPNQCYATILGEDVFSAFNTWHEWEAIFNYTHIMVANRPHHKIANVDWMKNILKERQVDRFNELYEQLVGKILIAELPPQPYCATEIRQALANGEDVSDELDPNVLDYIKAQHLYEK